MEPTESVLLAASAALGMTLSDPVDLGGGSRTIVLRCHTAARDTVVVKAYRDDPEALACFTAEAAGLAFTSYGPSLLAVDTATPLVVLSDLGTAPSLADALLGNSASDARSGLLAWATAYGQLAATTLGRQEELAALRSKYSRGQPSWDGASWISERITALPGVLHALDVPMHPLLDVDLAAVQTIADEDRYPVFSPGDVCPDNNLLSTDGLRVLDFEGAGYHSVFLDGAYTRMPFATCWCVFRLPAQTAAAVEQTYRAQITTGYPDLADDNLWRAGIRRAIAAWTLDITVVLTPRAMTENGPMHRRRRPVPSIRQLLHYRWRSLAEELECAGELPALADLARGLLVATQHWEVDPLPSYPAFGKGDRAR